MATDNVVLHIVLVGFHHKKGCQVEFSYPPMIEGDQSDSSKLPEEWKHLPFLALPDGCHNFTEDSTFFNLPPRKSYTAQTTVFAVSCYRQIATSLLKHKESDVTRGSVQKSVVVLTQEPVFGLLLVKLKMITHAYFEEKDFSKKEILKELYDHINASISKGKILNKSFGLSPQPLISKFHHKVLILYKLLLLEKRVLFYATPVNKLVGSIMALLSLFPGMVESGLQYCTKRPIEQISTEEAEEVSAPSSSITNPVKDQEKCEDLTGDVEKMKLEENSDGSYLLSSLNNGEVDQTNLASGSSGLWNSTSERASSIASSLSSKIGSLSSVLTSTFNSADNLDVSVWFSPHDLEDDQHNDDVSRLSFENSRLEMKTDSPARSRHEDETPALSESDKKALVDESFDEAILGMKSFVDLEEPNLHEPLPCNELGFPLSIFTQGYLCLPYVCLQQYDELSCNLSRGFVAGASNMLFTTQPDLVDVIVDIDQGELLFKDPNLKRVLHLSAADLRFADYLVANVSPTDELDDDEGLMTSTNWEGGDEWIQSQFSNYLISMLAVSLPREGGAKDIQDFNQAFMTVWKRSNNYQHWLRGKHKDIYNVKPSHPFQAQYTMSDMKLRLQHNLHGSEKGRKIEDAMANANQAVVNSGKAVSSALGSAKSAFSSWLSEKRNK